MAAKLHALNRLTIWLLLLWITLAYAVAQGNGSNSPQQASGATVLDLHATPGTPNLESGSVTFIGNATLLIRYAGFTILTDPNFLRKEERAYLGFGRSAKRLTDPAFAFESLPPLDLIIVTQLQGDHFDQVVQEKLDRTIPIMTTSQAASALGNFGFQALHPLIPWKMIAVKKGDAVLRITALPARHGNGIAASILPEAMGSMLEFGTPDGRVYYRIYLSGDTVLFDDLGEIVRRYPDIDLAMLNLGGEKLLGMMHVTMDAKQGADLLQLLAPRKAIPIHFDDYDHFKSSLEDFNKRVKIAEMQNRVVYLQRGEPYDFKVDASRTKPN